MEINYQPALARILVYEGGKVNDPRDPGGRTNMGITQTTFNAWLHVHGGAERDVYSITMAEVSAIYHDEFWERIKDDALPSGLDLVVFDAAVNSGVSMGVKWLQQAIGGIAVDGVLGSSTVKALSDESDIEGLIENVCGRRLATLEHLSTWKVYGAGWHARIANVQKIGISWNQAGKPTSDVDPIIVTSLGGHQKAPVSAIKPSALSIVQTHIVTGAAAVGTTATQLGAQLAPTSDTFSWMKYVLGGLTVLGASTGIALAVKQTAQQIAKEGGHRSDVDTDADSGLPSAHIVDPAPAAGVITQAAPTT